LLFFFQNGPPAGDGLHDRPVDIADRTRLLGNVEGLGVDGNDLAEQAF
jgi:hypothetical protein